VLVHQHRKVAERDALGAVGDGDGDASPRSEERVVRAQESHRVLDVLEDIRMEHEVHRLEIQRRRKERFDDRHALSSAGLRRDRARIDSGDADPAMRERFQHEAAAAADLDRALRLARADRALEESQQVLAIALGERVSLLQVSDVALGEVDLVQHGAQACVHVLHEQAVRRIEAQPQRQRGGDGRVRGLSGLADAPIDRHVADLEPIGLERDHCSTASSWSASAARMSWRKNRPRSGAMPPSVSPCGIRSTMRARIFAKASRLRVVGRGKPKRDACAPAKRSPCAGTTTPIACELLARILDDGRRFGQLLGAGILHFDAHDVAVAAEAGQ
jgi:hypothetical protein